MRPEKKAMVEEIREHTGGKEFVFLTDYKGMNMAQTSALRQRLRGTKARYGVVKNRLFRRAMSEHAWEGYEDELTGPTALITGDGDVVEAAKILQAFIKENQRPAIKMGILSGAVLSATDVEALASLPPREELLGRFVGTLAAPMTQLVGVLNQKVSSLVYVLKAVQEKKENA